MFDDKAHCGMKTERTRSTRVFEPQCNAVSGQKMKSLIPVLAAFIEAAEVTENTPLLKADRLAAFRTFFTHKAVLGLVICLNRIAGHIPPFQNACNGIGNGQHQAAVYKDGMLAADAF